MLNWKIHYWASVVIAVPLVVVICSGVLLHVRKPWRGVQPAEHTGTGTHPNVDLEDILAAVRERSALQVRGWDDIMHT